ncbi:PA0069 family radical SAM protein [Rhodobacter capsulatus]|uniref:PA0069 family radical SAM protein n=1 Tax=Rhodobacter capsulatus TaxID=1061 RepID=A0A4U1JNR6_RHOCA|nr:PA0069 family radical SAM protein [Rhodobacter capsulatus]TKD17426.1 PA0069 family radical SAM protein [Rhodobacter capsulatus]
MMHALPLPLDLPPADPRQRLRARGAAANPVGRFEPYARIVEPDGWDLVEDDRLLRTEVSVERPKSVITRNQSPDVPFDRSVNPYRGCEHGCIYCFARPTHGFLGLSAGLDFETRLIAKPEAPDLLARELSKRGYAVAPIALGTATDPYQPIEAEWGLTRGLLQVLSDFNHPVLLTTRGAGVLRDLDLLGSMAKRNLVHLAVSLTTLDEDLARKLEPRAPTPQTRLRIIREAARAGIPVRVMAAPIIPGLTDAALEAILTEARRAGARAAEMIPLRLPNEVAALFADWLARHYPLRAEKVLNAIAAFRGGKLNDPRFTTRMEGEGTEAELLARRFEVSCRRLSLAAALPPLDCTRFAVPPRAGEQLELF